MSELMRAVAFIFKRKGQREMSPLEFKHAVSLDLRWFAPSDALRFYQAAVRRGFVREDGEKVVAVFDPAAIEVPLRMKPELEVIEEEGPAYSPPPPPPPKEQEPRRPAPGLAGALAGALAVDPARLEDEARLEAERAGGLLSPEVALLLAARRRGLDVRPHVPVPSPRAPSS